MKKGGEGGEKGERRRGRGESGGVREEGEGNKRHERVKKGKRAVSI